MNHGSYNDYNSWEEMLKDIQEAINKGWFDEPGEGDTAEDILKKCFENADRAAKEGRDT
jgi:hypothetical protein